ncbi:hypothetical protein [Mesobacillus harenae]|uniref:hypothetical protein n=1 Tax=Mesobacillus harenae TaxID=2213203 RepID=UPI00157FEB37|nr:hypothetical protein [Mesobacillus harenae]
MYRKNCDRCHRPSYSSSEHGMWNCPICGNDLTAYPFFNAVTLERVGAVPKGKLESYRYVLNNGNQ